MSQFAPFGTFSGATGIGAEGWFADNGSARFDQRHQDIEGELDQPAVGKQLAAFRQHSERPNASPSSGSEVEFIECTYRTQLGEVDRRRARDPRDEPG
jgi:hypothetical protein